ncbi:hypothetical protein [Thalassoglobus polymorphus]|uniref:hypothetical protein n=1 Tax=Thalassoglobus polymorphus TaxID=2527994 RepID=UPI0018D1FF3B|nr:hypothetical protein [Thalassoglobus polymorphus]
MTIVIVVEMTKAGTKQTSKNQSISRGDLFQVVERVFKLAGKHFIELSEICEQHSERISGEAIDGSKVFNPNRKRYQLKGRGNVSEVGESST